MYNKLQDITLYYSPDEERKEAFQKKHNVISDLYVYHLNKYKPKKTTRISVSLGSKDTINGFFGSILTVEAQFDKEQYWSLDESEKNKMILDTIHRIALNCAKEYDWSKQVFNSAYEKVIQSKFIYRVELDKKYSRDKKHKASILIEKNEDCATISSLFYDQTGQLLKSVKLLDTFQWQGFHFPIVRRFKWFDKESFGIYLPNEELVIKAFLNKDNSKTIISPKKTSKGELKSYLNSITHQKFSSEQDKIEWLRS